MERAGGGCRRREGVRRPEEALAVLRRVRYVREALHGVFHAIAHDTPWPAADLAVLNDALTITFNRLRRARRAGGAEWAWEHPDGALDVMLPPVLREAADLLTNHHRRLAVQPQRHADETIGRYIHITRNSSLVEAGERVAQGQVVALSGNSGPSGGPHLPFDVQTCGPNRPPGYNAQPCGMTVPLSFRNTAPLHVRSPGEAGVYRAAVGRGRPLSGLRA